MFMQTVTFYHHEIAGNADEYTKTVLPGVYCTDGQVLSSSDKGIDRKSGTTVITNAENAHSYGSNWSVKIGDRFIIGEGEDISSFRELEDAKTVTGVTLNICGSDVDNVVITGV